jgi:endonuclease/exonuclease/phosphatase family metal-dependent hydrolase
MGRWSFVQSKGKFSQRLLVIMVYQVCKQSIRSAGGTTTFSQQWHHLRATRHTSPDPRKQFSSDLSAFLDRYPNDHVIITGDLNSWLWDPNDDKRFGKLVLKHRLRDILLKTHGTDSKIPTRKEGRRIDYILTTDAVATSVLHCGALHFDHIIDSGHRGLFLDLDIDTLLGGCPPTLSSPALCGIDSTNP